MNIGGRSVSKRELERRVGNLQQIGGTRHFEYSTGRAKGVQAVEVNTGSGIEGFSAGIRKVLEQEESRHG